MTLFRLLIGALIAAVSLPASAADFTFVSGASEPNDENTFSRTHCNVRLSGPIETGDAARFASFLASVSGRIEKDPRILGNPIIAVLCLDSEGGSLDEGIKIAELIRQDRHWAGELPFVHTRLEANSRCESACAIVFLAGTADDWEGPSYIARSMHPTARLGIHAPALALPAGQYDEGFVTDAYDVSLKSIAEILRVLHVGATKDGTPYSGTDSWISASMLEAMLQTPARSMRYVETVDDAGRWNIVVHPIAVPAFDQDTVYNSCFNTRAWREGRPSELYGDNYAFEVEPRTDASGQTELARFDVSIDELMGWSCSFAVTGSESFVIAPITSTDQETMGSTLSLYRPETRLSDIALPVERRAAPVATETPKTAAVPRVLQNISEFEEAETSALLFGDSWEPRYGGDSISHWGHNGSSMAWEQKDDFLWVWYHDPRKGLRDVGVLPGALLFSGKADGTYSGFARRFSQRCSDTIYPVKQTSLGTYRFVFEGQYRRRNDACAEGELRNDVLIFDILGWAPDRPIDVPDGSAPREPMRLFGVSSGLNFRAGPSTKARRLGELPAGLSNITLIGCRPRIVAGQWQKATVAGRRAMLDERWCSFNYNGRVGFVAGKHLSP